MNLLALDLNRNIFILKFPKIIFQNILSTSRKPIEPCNTISNINSRCLPLPHRYRRASMRRGRQRRFPSATMSSPEATIRTSVQSGSS